MQAMEGGVGKVPWASAAEDNYPKVDAVPDGMAGPDSADTNLNLPVSPKAAAVTPSLIPVFEVAAVTPFHIAASDAEATATAEDTAFDVHSEAPVLLAGADFVRHADLAGVAPASAAEGCHRSPSGSPPILFAQITLRVVPEASSHSSGMMDGVGGGEGEVTLKVKAKLAANHILPA